MQRNKFIINIMSNSNKIKLQEIMNLAWAFVKENGFNMSDALKVAWANVKLRAKLFTGIVEFRFKKVNGDIRQAFGTLKGDIVPSIIGARRASDKVQTYFDTEKREWRCFKKCNLI